MPYGSYMYEIYVYVYAYVYVYVYVMLVCAVDSLQNERKLYSAGQT